MKPWLGLALLALAGAARADYFFDQGFVRAPIRTDYDDPRRGTAELPLSFGPCLYPTPDPLVINSQCPTTRSVFAASNYFSQNVGADGRYWMLQMNNEPWEIDTSGSGPPGQSLPRANPGEGIMGFTALSQSQPGEDFKRAHLVLNHLYPNPHRPLGQYAIPFLSLVIDDDHGNGGPIGALNDPARPHVLSFVDRVWDYVQVRDPAPGEARGHKGMWLHYVWVATEWQGQPRMIFVNLLWNGITWSARWNAGLSRRWNWPMRDSGLYPGANIAFFNAGEIGLHCPALEDLQPLRGRGDERRYTIDLQALFRCASDEGLFDTPMPTDQALPIKTVGWAVEGTGYFGLWVSLHDMRVLAPGEPAPLDPVRVSKQQTSPVMTSTAIETIRATWRRSCERLPACRAAAKDEAKRR